MADEGNEVKKDIEEKPDKKNAVKIGKNRRNQQNQQTENLQKESVEAQNLQPIRQPTWVETQRL